MTITIPEIYIASCVSFLLGALAIVGLAYGLSAWQRRTKGRPNRTK